MFLVQGSKCMPWRTLFKGHRQNDLVYFYCMIQSGSLIECLQVINRAKLERAGKDNVFVKLLYGKDRALVPQSIEEQQRIGKGPLAAPAHACYGAQQYFIAAAAAPCSTDPAGTVCFCMIPLAELHLSSGSLHQAHTTGSHARELLTTINIWGLSQGIQSLQCMQGGPGCHCWSCTSPPTISGTPPILRQSPTS